MKPTKTKKGTRMALATVAALALLYGSCGNEMDFSSQQDSRASSSGSLGVSGDFLDDTDASGADADITLSLGGVTLSRAIAAGDDLGSFVSVYAADAGGVVRDVSARNTGSADAQARAAFSVTAAEAAGAGASVLKVTAKMTSDLSDKETPFSGAFYVTVKGDLVSDGLPVTGTGGSVTLGANPTSGTFEASRGETGTAAYDITFDGKYTGYKLRTGLTSEELATITVGTTDDAGNATEALSGASVTKAGNTENGISVTVSATVSAVLSEAGRVTITVPLNLFNDHESETGSKTFGTKGATYAITGVEAVLSEAAGDLSATGYGTVGATAKSKTLTLTLKDAKNTVAFADGATNDALSAVTQDGKPAVVSDWTLSSDKKSATFTVSYSEDLGDSSNNSAGTLSFAVDGSKLSLGSLSATQVPVSGTVAYALNYKSMLSAPSLDTVRQASGGSEGAAVAATTVRLDAYGDGTRLAKAVSAGDTVGTVTIGTASGLAAKALSAVPAGGTEIPVAIAYTGDAPSGAVTFTVTEALVGKSLVIRQTNAKNIMRLIRAEDYESGTVGWDGYVNTFSKSPDRGGAELVTKDGNTYVRCYGKDGGLKGVFFAPYAGSNTLATVADGTDFVFGFDVQFFATSGAFSFVVSNANGNGLITKGTTSTFASPNPQGGVREDANCLLYMIQDDAGSSSWTVNGSDSLVMDNGAWYAVTVARTGGDTFLTVRRHGSSVSAFKQNLSAPGAKGGLGQLQVATKVKEGADALCFDNAFIAAALQ